MDGVWLVIVEEGERHELPIHLPHADYDEVLASVAAGLAHRIRSLDGPEIWQRCLAAADITQDPVELFLATIADLVESGGPVG